MGDNSLRLIFPEAQDLVLGYHSDIQEHHQQMVVVLRGLNGCGKSTFARELQFHCNKMNLTCEICSMEQYFLDDCGNIRFDPQYVREANRFCFQRFQQALWSGRFNVLVVDNKNKSVWDYGEYEDEANSVKARLEFVEFECDDMEMAHELNERSDRMESLYDLENDFGVYASNRLPENTVIAIDPRR